MSLFSLFIILSDILHIFKTKFIKYNIMNILVSNTSPHFTKCVYHKSYRKCKSLRATSLNNILTDTIIVGLSISVTNNIYQQYKINKIKTELEHEIKEIELKLDSYLEFNADRMSVMDDMIFIDGGIYGDVIDVELDDVIDIELVDSDNA